MSARDRYEMVIGLEVHCELKTASKIFCSCPTAFGAEPNTQCCPVCTGMPGALPVLNRQAVAYAVKAGLATNCRIASHSRQDRKNYFYPDLPKGYQISQLDQPLCENGFLEIETEAGSKRDRHHPASTSRRTRASSCTSRGRAPSSTATAAGCRSSRSSRSPTCARRRRPRPICASCAPSCSTPASPTAG